MTPDELGDVAESLVPVACRLVGAVHDDGPADVARALADVPPDRMPALAVVLAAMVNPDRSPADLLAWVTWDDTPPARQPSLFTGWNNPADPPPPHPRPRVPAATEPVNIDDLDLDRYREWPDDLCHRLRNEDRHVYVDPYRKPYTTAGRREYDRRRNRASRYAKAASQQEQIPVD
jgi:hypothetical protein